VGRDAHRSSGVGNDLLRSCPAPDQDQPHVWAGTDESGQRSEQEIKSPVGLHPRHDADQGRVLGHPEIPANLRSPAPYLEFTEVDRTCRRCDGPPAAQRTHRSCRSLVHADEAVAGHTEEPAIPGPPVNRIRMRKESHDPSMTACALEGPTEPQCTGCEDVISAVPTMDDVIGATELVRLQPICEASGPFAVAESNCAPHGFDRMNRIDFTQ